MKKRVSKTQGQIYKVTASVVSQKGKCLAGHKIGDKISYEGTILTGYLCPSAFAVLYRYMYALKFGAEFPFGNPGKNTIRIACPDADNPVVFELKRENVQK